MKKQKERLLLMSLVGFEPPNLSHSLTTQAQTKGMRSRPPKRYPINYNFERLMMSSFYIQAINNNFERLMTSIKSACISLNCSRNQVHWSSYYQKRVYLSRISRNKVRVLHVTSLYHSISLLSKCSR